MQDSFKNKKNREGSSRAGEIVGSVGQPPELREEDEITIFNARTWAAKEARLVLERIADRPHHLPIVLKMAYGPSGKPHLGTACEVVRSCMIAKVLREIQPRPVIVLAFADNMDGLRKVAENIPNRELLLNYIGVPVCRVPDPFGTTASLAEHSISGVGGFLEKLGYDSVEYIPKDKYSTLEMAEISNNGEKIVMLRSSDMYQNGLFDRLLLKVLHKHKEILDVMLPDLGEERRATYSPLMPISPKTGRVLEKGIKEYKESSIVFEEDGEIFETEVNGVNYKAQWKVDFGMQWIGLEIDYEMAGKDISIGSVPLSSKICRILGGTPPPGMMYEMFLAADGSKMSKTKGNGVSMEDWFRYGIPGAVRHFMFLNPMTAKRVDVLKMPSYIDRYIDDLEKFVRNPDPENPIWYSEPNAVLPKPGAAEGKRLFDTKWPEDISSTCGLNINNCSNLLEEIVSNKNDNQNKAQEGEKYEFERKYAAKDLRVSELPNLRAGLALSLLQGLHPDSLKIFIEFLKKKITNFNELDMQISEVMFNFYREKSSSPQIQAFPQWMEKYLPRFTPSGDAEKMQTELYSLGNEAVSEGDVKTLKDWFGCLYRGFFGQESGPRLGSFFALYGPEASRDFIQKALRKDN